jgi:hypothetical protein
MYVVFSTTALVAQGAIPTITTSDPISEYLTKGGSYAVIALLLYFYRRDWANALDVSKNSVEMLTRIVEGSTKAQTESALAITASTAAVNISTSATNSNTVALNLLINRLDRSAFKAPHIPGRESSS